MERQEENSHSFLECHAKTILQIVLAPRAMTPLQICFIRQTPLFALPLVRDSAKPLDLVSFLLRMEKMTRVALIINQDSLIQQAAFLALLLLRLLLRKFDNFFSIFAVESPTGNQLLSEQGEQEERRSDLHTRQCLSNVLPFQKGTIERFWHK